MKYPGYNLKFRSDPRYESDLSLLSMVIDSIVGRPSNKTRWTTDHFSYDDTRAAFMAFCQASSETEDWETVYQKLQALGTEPAILAARSLRWAMSNRKFKR